MWHGVERGRLRPSSASVLLNDLPIEQAIRPTAVPNLDLITGSSELVNTDLVLGDVKGREQTLRHLVRQLLGILMNTARPTFLPCFNLLGWK
jgi:hypothetical protein